MKKYFYSLFIVSILSGTMTASAQSTPSGQTTANAYPDDRPNYNYLGLLGLLGLYGLHKKRVAATAGADRRVG